MLQPLHLNVCTVITKKLVELNHAIKIEQSVWSFLFHTEKVNIKYKSTLLTCSGTFVIMMKSI